MTKPCAVPKCRTGCRGVKKKCSVFRVPKNLERFKKWEAMIPGLRQTQYVCEEHFKKGSIIRTSVKRDQNGRIISEIPYIYPKLDEFAVPTIFETTMEQQMDVIPQMTSLEAVEDMGIISPSMDVEPQESMHQGIPSPNDILPSFKISNMTLIVHGNGGGSENNSVPIPKSWGIMETSTERNRSIIFSLLTLKRKSEIDLSVVAKSVILGIDKSLRYFVHERAVNLEKCTLESTISDITLLPQILEKFERIKLCSGLGAVNEHYLSANGVFKDCVDQWHGNNCTLVTKRKRCDECMKMRRFQLRKEKISEKNPAVLRVRQASNPCDEKKLQLLRKKSSRERRLKNRAKKRGALLRQSLSEKADEISRIRLETLEEKCASLDAPLLQKTALAEIIAAASKKGANNRRYTEEWIMLCMLLNIKSPGYYDFLRERNLLPLPCKRTIRSYFSLINMKCGFDEQFGKLLQKHFDSKTPLQRHGLLLLDEINLRKSVTVCSRNLSYVGLTDLGDDGPKSSDIEDQATHGLVFMFQPLADSYTQPIAVFASKNSVKGEELAKLVVKGITFLENNGAKIHGVIGDDASTNAKMLSVLGVSGAKDKTKTWFTHPLDDERKVFGFSDVPHVIKCIRNRLYNKKRLRMKSSDSYISWEFFNVLFELDTKHAGNARVCPRITQRHVVLDNTSKMRVRLATQIFSDSVAKGLAFYKSHKLRALDGCDETIRFCKWINSMFDALNRKSPNEGLKPDTEDFKVLQESLVLLNDWETAVEKHEIRPDEFLTPETSRGMRLSIQSTMDLCRYLIERFEFQYLLTGKVNQDNLEKFFGCIRQAAGSNDHPHTPTFLQLYKLLSVYSVIKPPKFGNCTVSDEPSPHVLVSLHDLKMIYGEKSEGKMVQYRRKIEEKLDHLIEHHDLADDVIELNSEHDYTLSPALDCIIYYVTGYLCKQVLRIYKSCTTCVRAVTLDSPCTSSLSQLVDMKSRGGLIHANTRFFNLIRHVESCFVKHSSQQDVFDRTLEEVMSSYDFSFPCTEHASMILSFAIIYYIRLRMRQFTQQVNSKLRIRCKKKTIEID